MTTVDENDRHKSQDAEAGALRGSLRYLTRYLVQSSFFINRIAAIHPIQYLNALKLHRSIKKAKATTNGNILPPSTTFSQATQNTSQFTNTTFQTKLKNILFLTKKYTIILVAATPGFIKSYYVGLFLFRTYGKNATAHNYILTTHNDNNSTAHSSSSSSTSTTATNTNNATATTTTTIEYNKRKYLLIYQPLSNSYEVKQGFVNGAIAGCAFASFFIGWDVLMSKSSLLYSTIISSFTTSINPPPTTTTTIPSTTILKNLPIFNQYLQKASYHYHQLSLNVSPSQIYTNIIQKPLPFSITGSFPVHVAVYSVFYGTYECLKPIIYRSLRAILISSKSSNSSSINNDIQPIDSILHHGYNPNHENPNHTSNSRINLSSEPTSTLWHRFLLGNVRFWSISIAGGLAGMVSEIVNYYGEYFILNGFTTLPQQIHIQQQLQQRHNDAILSKTTFHPLSATSNTSITLSTLANLAHDATNANKNKSVVNTTNNIDINNNINNTTTITSPTTTPTTTTTAAATTANTNNNKNIIRMIFTYFRCKPFPRISSLLAVGLPSSIGFLAYEHGKQAILLP